MQDMNKTIWKWPLKILDTIPFVKVNMNWYTDEENKRDMDAVENEVKEKHERWKKWDEKIYYGDECPRCGATEQIERRWMDDVSGKSCLFGGYTRTKHETVWFCHTCKKTWKQDYFENTSVDKRWDRMKELGFVRADDKKTKDRVWVRRRIEVEWFPIAWFGTIGILLITMWGMLIYWDIQTDKIVREHDKKWHQLNVEIQKCDNISKEVRRLCEGVWATGQDCTIDKKLSDAYNKCKK